ncbi:MAG: xylulose kinase [Ardenticatenaceae bacterium]|nr:xylulose kinase [Ardenticatenaceae bacterium]
MKVALITLHGRVLGWETEAIQLHLTPDGGAEQSPEEWWQAFLSATARLLARKLVPAGDIQAVCCSTQGEGTLAVDEDGRPLTNCILWMDMRGAPYLHKQFKGLVNLDNMSLAKILRWVRLTGGMPSPTGKDPAGHMLLIRDRFPEVYARTYKFLNVLDYLNLRLTGRFTATFDSILTSWVTDNRDPDAIRYDAGLVRACGIDAEKLPEIVPCTAVLGPLKPDVAAELGLPPDVQVVAGAIDNTAAAIGSGAVEDYATHLYIGTSSWLAAHVPFKKTDVLASLASVPCAVNGRYLLTALQATAGGNLTFLRDNVLYHQDELLQEAQVPDIFKVLDQIAGRTAAGANGVIYTPWIWGERAPVDDRNLRAGLYNLSLHNTREDIIRAFLEGVALNTRWLLRPVVKFLGRSVPAINVVGGGAQSDVWCQIFADVLDTQIRQVRDPIYANARGAAWIAAVGLGQITFADVPGFVTFNREYEPDPANRALYDERFAVFQQIYRQTKGIYKRLNG